MGKHWLPRRTWAGELTAKHAASHFCFLPDTFNPRFYNCAPEDQQLQGGYIAGEEVTLEGMTSQGLERFRLPSCSLAVTAIDRDEVHDARSVQPDTLIVYPAERTFALVCRCAFSQMGLHTISLDNPRL